MGSAVSAATIALEPRRSVRCAANKSLIAANTATAIPSSLRLPLSAAAAALARPGHLPPAVSARAISGRQLSLARSSSASGYASQKDADLWKAGATDDIAWESHQIAREQIYGALKIPIESCLADNNSCANSCAEAPAGPVHLDSAYMSKAATIAGQQLAKAGFRLASLLNSMWPNASPISSCAGLH